MKNFFDSHMILRPECSVIRTEDCYFVSVAVQPVSRG